MLSKSMRRLSSGKKINQAEDDSAGIAIAKRLHTQVNNISQTGRNGNDGVSVVQTAEGALNEVQAMLQRIRELAVQGANGTYSNDDRNSIQEEVEDLEQEILRVTEQTQFSSIPLLNGNLDRRSYCTVTPYYTDKDANGDPILLNTSSWGKVTYSSDSVSANVYGINVKEKASPASTQLVVDGSAVEGGRIKINGASIDITAGMTKQQIEVAISEVVSNTGMKYEIGTLTTNNSGSEVTIEVEISEELRGVVSASAEKASGKDAIVEFGTNDKNERIGFTSTARLSTEGNYVTVTDNGGFYMVMRVGEVGDYSFQVTDMGTMPIQIGIAEGQVLDIRIPEINLETLGLLYTNLSTQNNCESAIGDLDKALSYISEIRGGLGAYQNRLESAVRSIEVAEENVTSSLSRIEDTDMAEEMTYYTQMNVLTQAGISVLTQANERPQMLLQLLQ